MLLKLFCGIFVVESLLWNSCCVTFVVYLELSNISCGTCCLGVFVVESLLWDLLSWNLCHCIVVVESLWWNISCGVFVVESL